MIDLWIVRHGEPETDPMLSDPGLSSIGHAQAKETAEKLKALDIGEAFSSPRLRAKETAKYYLDLTSKPLLVEQYLRELPSYWVLQSQRQAWLKNTLMSTWEDVEPEIRVWKDSLETWAKQRQVATVVFSHFVAVNALIACATGKPEVCQQLPAHASISHFRVSCDHIAYLGTDSLMDADIRL